MRNPTFEKTTTMKRNISYWHFCTNSIPNGILFKDREDYKAVMNFIPIALQQADVTIYCFVIMSNHVHFLLSGAREEVYKFYLVLKKLLKRYLNDKYGDSSVMNQFTDNIIAVITDEYFRNVTAYILRNPYKAKICDPYRYRWGTAALYFNPFLSLVRSERIDSMRVRSVEKMLRSRQKLPGKYVMADGIVLPQSYVNYQFIENKFGTSLDFFERIRYWNQENEVEEIQEKSERSAFSDAELLAKLQTDFEDHHVSGFADMDPTTFRKFISKLHRKYGASRKQVCRLMGADEELIERFY